MKRTKIFALLLALCLLLCAAPAIFAAEDGGYDYSGEGFTAHLTPDGVLTISGTSMPTHTVYDLWDEEKSLIKSVIIQDGLQNIGPAAFDSCSNLTSVRIPDSVTAIGRLAFAGCESLTEIQIPDGVTYIGKGAFNRCKSLASIAIPERITEINPGLFSGCASLTDLQIPDGVTKIYELAFSGCSSLKNITIPNSVTWICTGAFMDCTSLTGITIPDKIVLIESSTFEGCTSLTNITIPDSVTSIGQAAFDGCTSLASITIPDSVTSIGNGAFHGCTSLESINIPNGITTIDAFTFHDCTNLTSITIPSSVTSIEIAAFHRCENLREIHFLGNKPDITYNYFFTDYIDGEYVDDIFHTFSDTTILYYPAGAETWTSVDQETREGIGGIWQPYGGYKVVDGAEGSWIVDSGKALSFRADGALKDCTGVMVDGTLVDSSNYKLSEGSTVVELSADYMKTLSTGTHTLRVLFKDGTAETTFTVKAAEAENPTEPTEPSTPTDPESPKTGESVYVFSALLLAVLSLSGVAVCLKPRKAF